MSTTQLSPPSSLPSVVSQASSRDQSPSSSEHLHRRSSSATSLSHPPSLSSASSLPNSIPEMTVAPEPKARKEKHEKRDRHEKPSSKTQRAGTVTTHTDPVTTRGISNSNNSNSNNSRPFLSEATYVLPEAEEGTFGTKSPSLAELAHVVRLQSYQELKHTQSRIRLSRQLISSNLSARLSRCGDLARTSMVEYFKSDQKRDFAILYNAIHELHDSCERLAMLQPELDVSKASQSEPERPKSLVTFFQDVPIHSRDTILFFISTIRSDPRFLADRLGKLSTAELDNLARFHQAPVAPESVLPSSVGRKGILPPINAPNAVDKLLSLQRTDPIHVLIYSVFASSNGPDSAEELRRTDIFGSVCGRLLSEKKGEKFLFAVMDSWAAMREWSAKTNLEVCLMSFLQDGAFLLEQPDGQPSGKAQAELSRKIDHISEEFYSKAVRKLFEVLDDEPNAGGIPEGILELGNAILQKIDDPKKQKSAEVFIVAKWFFGKFLNNAIQYPEQYGMLVGHHINEWARQRILRTIVQRMCNVVFKICYTEWKASAPIDPIVRTRVESIMARFRSARPKDAAPVLIPAKHITSPRETKEVQPYLVVCPADLVTLYTAIYPESQRPTTGTSERDILRNKSSYGRSSRPLLSRPPSIFEAGNGSLLSQSHSSLGSENGLSSFTAPLLDFQSAGLDEKYSGSAMPSPSSSFVMPPPLQPSGASIRSIQSMSSEQDVQLETFAYEVKMAMSELIRSLGPDVISAKIHPCAEKWALLFVSSDGNEVSTRMKTDWEDEDDEDDTSHDSDSEDETNVESAGFNKDYVQVKHTIMKLVEEFEVPEEMINEGQGKEQRKKFSNRASASARKHASPVATPMSTFVADQNPYHQAGGLTALFERYPKERQKLEIPSQDTELSGREYPSVLMTMLSAASSQCIARGEYLDGQLYHQAVILLKHLSPSLARDGFAELLRIIARGFHDSIEKSTAAIEHLEAWFVWLTLANERHDNALTEMLQDIKTLRVKMWYITDVRNSAAYDDARNVTLALKKMGVPPKPSAGRPVAHQRSRSTLNRMSSGSFNLLKSDSLIDTIAAPVEYGGLNKLSDDQTEVTKAWIKRYNVENFCQGEERIHRFCCEVDKCVNKLIGDKILTGPVLWSSELFARDDKELSSLRRKGDFHLAGVGALTIPMDDKHDTDNDSRRKHQDVRTKVSAGDLFSMSRGRSQSIVSTMSDAPSIRPKASRGSYSESMMDKQDLFAMSDNSSTADSTPTSAFWSPFGSSNRTSRPNTAQSSQSPTSTLMAFRSPETESEEKKKFLATLKKELTGLLLSDLGLEVWSQGSETDAWFSGGLGDECLQRKEDQDKELARIASERNSSATKVAKSSTKMSRKRSTRSLRKTAVNSGIFETLGKGEVAAPVATYEHVGHEPHSGEENSSSSDATARSSNSPPSANKNGLLAFPYDLAFRRLMLKFSTHPNPFAKLKALWELEVLIVAKLSSTTGKTFVRRGTLANVPDDYETQEVNDRMSSLQIHQQPMNLEETLQTIDERRHAGGAASPHTPTGTRSPSGNPPSTDMIVEVWQQLFRQCDVRPRTLFRDLQFIAAFVPATILDRTTQGKAFWDMAYAAQTLKLEVVKTMVEVADEIVLYHTKRRNTSTDSSKLAKAENLEKSKPTEWISRYTMKDAANMWIITAKEGDATAQRELAIFYLTHPNLLPLVTKPMSKVKDTFRGEMMAGVPKGVDPEKCDPAGLCVSHHWMELSARVDELAKKYLRQREDQTW